MIEIDLKTNLLLIFHFCDFKTDKNFIFCKFPVKPCQLHSLKHIKSTAY